jgi:hypothetical protein
MEPPEAYSAFLAHAAEQRRTRIQIFFKEPTLDEWMQLDVAES